MTREELERIMAVWQQRLHLHLWEIKINWSREVGKDNLAEISVHDYNDQATIAVSHDFTEWSDFEANRIMVHELLHCYEHESRQAVEAMNPVCSTGVYELLWSRYNVASEWWVDVLAHRFVELAGLA